MTDLEKEALQALSFATMQMASSGKRFRNDMLSHLNTDPQFKLTRREAIYLWQIIHTYRRQISSAVLRTHAEAVHLAGDLPLELDSPIDHRELDRPQRDMPVVVRQKTRFEEELERGGGKLRL